MLKDIPELKVVDVAVAIVSEKNDLNQDVWNAYIVNMKNEMIEGVLVTSRGYGEMKGEAVKTSTLRHFLDEVEPNSYKLIEPIISDVIELSNEYWVSFYHHNKIFDRKYLFVPGSIKRELFTQIPLINKSGIMIK